MLPQARGEGAAGAGRAWARLQRLEKAGEVKEVMRKTGWFKGRAEANDWRES